MVGTKGTWLDVLDAGLAGDRLEKDIFFLVTKKEEGLDLFSIKTYMKNHIPDLEIEGHDAPPNRASKDTWVFLSSNASYQHGKMIQETIGCHVFFENKRNQVYLRS